MTSYRFDRVKGLVEVKVPSKPSKGQTCLGDSIAGIVFISTLIFLGLHGSYIDNLLLPNPHMFSLIRSSLSINLLISFLIAFTFTFLSYRIYYKLLSIYLRSKRGAMSLDPLPEVKVPKGKTFFRVVSTGCVFILALVTTYIVALFIGFIPSGYNFSLIALVIGLLLTLDLSIHFYRNYSVHLYNDFFDWRR